MLIIEPVLEAYEATDFTLWPVAGPPPDRLLPVSVRMSPAEVGTAMAVLARYNKGHRERHGRSPESGAELLRRLVSGESVIAPGGLRVRDTATGITVVPGCCFGLENWRDWFRLLDGEEPWLGHDPTPRAELSASHVRLSSDTDRPTEPAIEIRLAELAEHLAAVQGELAGFLELVGRWAVPYGRDLASAVVGKVAEGIGA